MQHQYKRHKNLELHLLCLMMKNRHAQNSSYTTAYKRKYKKHSFTNAPLILNCTTLVYTEKKKCHYINNYYIQNQSFKYHYKPFSFLYFSRYTLASSSSITSSSSDIIWSSVKPYLIPIFKAFSAFPSANVMGKLGRC